jgi:hypothetical protein
MNLNEAEKHLMINAAAGNATLLVSPSGFGKSTMVMKVFKRYRAEQAALGKSVGLGVIFAATQTPSDLIGYQFMGKRTFDLPDGTQKTFTVTDPSVPVWMLDVFTGKPASLFDTFFLVIEEYGQGDPDTKKAAAEIFLNGGTAPFYLPEGSIRIACSNQGSRYGVTKDFLFSIARRTLCKIDPDVDILVDHMDKPYEFQGKMWNTMSATKAWAKTHPTEVFEAEPKEDGPWCNPRTLCAMDRYAQCAAAVNGGEIPVNDGSFMEMCAGTVGMPVTQSYVGFLQFRTQLPSYEDVVKDPDNCPVPAKADLLMLMAYEVAAQTRVEHLTESIKYISRMPKDMGVTYITSLLRRDYKGLINQPAMQGWIGKNAALVSIIASMSQ